MVFFALLSLYACTSEFDQAPREEQQSVVLSELPVDLFMAEFDGTEILHFEAGDWNVDRVFDLQSDSVASVLSLTWREGLFYISPRQPQNSITIADDDGQVMDVLEHPYLEEPVKVLVDDENLYVLCNDSGLVLVFDRSSHEFIRHFGWAEEQQLIRYPHDMVWGPDGNLYIVTENTNIGFVQVWSPLGEYLGGFGLDITDEPWIPSAITFNRKGEILVADYWNRCIRLFDMEQNYLGKHIVLAAPEAYPENMKLGIDNKLYVSASEKLYIFAEDGEQLAAIDGHVEHIGAIEFVY